MKPTVAPAKPNPFAKTAPAKKKKPKAFAGAQAAMLKKKMC